MKELIENSFKAITPEILQYWIKNDVNLIPESVRKLYFENPLVRPIFKEVVKKYFHLIEPYFKSPEKAVEKLVEYHPENKDILESEEARKYIEEQAREIYELFQKLIDKGKI